MRKLEALVLEDHIDAALRFLGNAGVVQFIDMEQRSEIWKSVLVPLETPIKTLNRCSDILSKIETSFKELGLEPEEDIAKDIPVTKEQTEELLTKVEQRHAKLPIKDLAVCLMIISKVDRLIASLEIAPETTLTEALEEKPVDKALAEMTEELSEIEKTTTLPALTKRKALMKEIRGLTTEKKAKLGERLEKIADIDKKLLTMR
ncbi:hypothetical protein KEJ15_09250, partial [Candidatus Bathyarchaeota archaeon]|nr:hypothetical protein [Candidatus Bathyarchaeota archaeon]